MFFVVPAVLPLPLLRSPLEAVEPLLKFITEVSCVKAFHYRRPAQRTAYRNVVDGTGQLMVKGKCSLTAE